MASLQDCIVVMPALNEEGVIGNLIRAVTAQGVREVVVIDDASDDATAQEAEAAGATVITLLERLGAWGATQTGIRYAVRRGALAVITMDSDGQHPPDALPQIVAPLGVSGSHVVIGCCPQRGSPLRQLAWRWIKRTSGLAMADITSGFRAYDRLAIRKLASWPATLIEYQDVGILLLLQNSGLKIRDISVAMNARTNGKSRIFRNWGVVAYYMAHTLLLGACKRKPGRSVASHRSSA